VNSNQEGLIYEQMLRYRRFPDDLIVGSGEAVQAVRDHNTWE